MGIVNYGHRAVPHVYLGAPLLSPERTGADSWNASHWSNAGYDALFDQFTAAPDLDSQRSIAGQMEALLDDEVPSSSPISSTTSRSPGTLSRVWRSPAWGTSTSSTPLLWLTFEANWQPRLVEGLPVGSRSRSGVADLGR